MVEVKTHVGRGAVSDELDEMAQIHHWLAVELPQLHIVGVLISQCRITCQNL